MIKDGKLIRGNNDTIPNIDRYVMTAKCPVRWSPHSSTFQSKGWGTESGLYQQYITKVICTLTRHIKCTPYTNGISTLPSWVLACYVPDKGRQPDDLYDLIRTPGMGTPIPRPFQHLHVPVEHEPLVSHPWLAFHKQRRHFYHKV